MMRTPAGWDHFIEQSVIRNIPQFLAERLGKKWHKLEQIYRGNISEIWPMSSYS